MIGRIKITGVLLLIVFGAISSCKKYEEGPLISFRSEKARLTEPTWRLDKYLKNGVDETSLVLISDYKEQYAEDGDLIRSYIKQNGALFSEKGTWAFSSNEGVIDITGLSSMDWSIQDSTLSAPTLAILRLKSKEFWYSFSNGEDIHEFHLVK